MKVRITAPNFIVPVGTVLEVGPEAPRSWVGKYEVVKSGVKRVENEGADDDRASNESTARTSRKRDPG